jgi:hypothetical protein
MRKENYETFFSKSIKPGISYTFQIVFLALFILRFHHKLFRWMQQKAMRQMPIEQS